MGLFKSAKKAVSKAVKQVTAVAVKPAAVVASASLNAVGARSAAANLADFTHLSETEQKIGKAAGVGIQVGGAAILGAAVAPTIGAAAGKVGGVALKGGGLLKGAIKTLGPTLAGLLRKGPAAESSSEVEEAAPTEGPGNALADAARALSGKVGKAVNSLKGTSGYKDAVDRVKMAAQGQLSRVPGFDTGPVTEAGMVAPGFSGAPWWAIALGVVGLMIVAFWDRRK